MRHGIRGTGLAAVRLVPLLGVPALAAAPTAGVQRWAIHRTRRQVAPLRLHPAQLLRTGPTSTFTTSPAASVATSLHSGNWSGYQLSAPGTGAFSAPPTTFTSISGERVVPTATQKVAGQAEHAATWIGIGGGNDVAAATTWRRCPTSARCSPAAPPSTAPRPRPTPPGRGSTTAPRGLRGESGGGRA